MDLIVNTPFTILVTGPISMPLTDATVLVGSGDSSMVPTVFQLTPTNVWRVTFTPTTADVYTLYAFEEIQVRLQATTKGLESYLRNLEDEALGSWSWNKTTGLLTMLRQNGSPLATFDVVENTVESSRERN
jgi:hypothetical protein